MSTIDIINLIIRARSYQTYLEIGILYGGCFHTIDCKHKVSVDPNHTATYMTTSDKYFATHSENFDFIFIDGEHREAQVDRDIANALAHLTPGGIIMLHDCLPPTEFMQTEAASQIPYGPWTGTVWKAVLKMMVACPYRTYIIDTDYGCGIIDTTRTRVVPTQELPIHLTFQDHFPLLRQFTVSAAAFRHLF